METDTVPQTNEETSIVKMTSINLNAANPIESANNPNNSTSFNLKLDKTLFTFKPKLNPKSELLTQNIINFHERQSKHLKKQQDLVSQPFVGFIFLMKVYSMRV
jgi:hypothetical protein